MLADTEIPPPQVAEPLPMRAYQSDGQPDLGIRDERGRITPHAIPDRPFLGPTPFKMPEDYKQTPPRPWLYGKFLLRKHLSVDVAPGGLGKSTLSVSEAIDMVTGGKVGLGPRVPYPLRVWIFNLEDPRDDVEKAVIASLMHHKIDPTEVEGRLFFDSGRDQQFKLGVQGRNGAAIQAVMRDRMIEFMLANQIDVLIIDPFVSSHAVTENDNNAQDMIAKEWGVIAERTNAAIRVVHHSRKQDNTSEVTVDSARGGKALTDASRVTRVFNRMTEDEAARAGVDNHRLYFRVYNDKANFAPPADRSDWYHLASFDYDNPDPEGHFEADSIGVVERWEWVSNEILDPKTALAVQKGVAAKDWRKDVRAKAAWIGHLVAEVTGLSVEAADEREEIKGMIKLMFERGLLIDETRKDDHRKERKFVAVGEWQSLQTEVFE